MGGFIPASLCHLLKLIYLAIYNVLFLNKLIHRLRQRLTSSSSSS